LRNGWYTENYTGSAKGAIGAGAFIGNAGDGKIASAARVDYAEAAAVVLVGAGHEGKTYELAGDEAYTLTELAAEISKQSGKTIPYSNLTEAAYASILKGFGLPDALAEMLGDDFKSYSTNLSQAKDKTPDVFLKPFEELKKASRKYLDID
jgi:NAD(P)H dehydrogenase (quinone)